MLFQPPLPPKYAALSDQDMAEAIRQRKQTLGSRLVILGHHYQQDDVIQFADFTGESRRAPNSSCSAAYTSWPSLPTSSPATTFV